MNNIIVKEYLGSGITFKMIEGNIYADATEMAKIIDNGLQKLKDWKRSARTIELIEELNKINEVEKSHIELIVSNRGGLDNGRTWIHETLILDFAQYLNIKFKIWCQSQITTLLREGSVSLTPKSEEDMLLELFPDTDSNLVLLTANTIRENKRLVLENKNLVTEVIRKEDIIIGYVDKTTLAEKRQILNRVVKHNTSDYKARYGELYRQFEMKYHINLNYRFNKYNEENTPKCKSKMAYICEIMGNTNELYEIAVKLYESDVKELVAQMYGLKDTTVI